MFDFKFDWKPEMETHIETVDTQHKQLFSYGRDIEQAIKIGCVGVNEKQLVDIVCHLREYVSYNTYEEEKIMEEMKYSKIEEHKKAHNEFIQKIMQINIPELREKPLEKLKEIKNIIVEYIFSHILMEDIAMGKDYVLYLKKCEKNKSKDNKQEKIKEKSLEEKIKEQLYGYKICDLDVTEVYLYKNQTREGEMVAVFKGNVQKLVKLNALQRSSYFSDIDRIGKIIDKTYQPDVMDYISTGDVEGRLNFHIIPKKETDEDWGNQSVFLENKEMLKKEEYKKIISKLNKLLVY
jgi:hemerythrin